MVGPNDIGDVYIDVHADTKGLAREIRAAAQVAGRDFSDEFNDSLGAELDKGFTPVGRELREKLAREGKLGGEKFSEGLEKEVQSRIRRWDMDLSHAIVFGDWDKVVDQFDDVDDAVERVNKRMRDLNESGELDKGVLNESAQSLERYVAKFKELTEAREEAAKLKSAAWIQEESKRLKEAAEATRKYNDENERSAGVFSRLKGSRNDFLNFIGGLARGLRQLPDLLSHVVTGLVDFGRSIGRAVSEGRGFGKVFNGFKATVTGIGEAFGKFAAKGGLAFAVALTVLSKTVTVLFSGLSSLLGIVTLLAGALVNGLGAALLAIGPMMGALAVGVTTAVLAFKNMDKQTKKSFKGLQEFGAELGKSLSKKVFAGASDSIKTLEGALRGLKPMLSETASVLNGWATNFIDTLSSGEMKKNLDVFETTWPSILRNLSSAFTSTFRGLTGVLAAISPSVEKITDKISEAANKFGDWANTAKGKNAIADWFDRAWDSASKLWDIATNVGSALLEIFDIGSGTSNDLLDSIDDVTQGFEDWTKSDQGRKDIKQWFKDARSLASTLWDVLKKIGKAFDEWDTEENRKNFETLLTVAGETITLALKAIGLLSQAFDLVAGIGDKIGDIFSGIGGGLGDLFSGKGIDLSFFDKLSNKLGEIFTSFSNWGSKFDPAPTIEKAFGKIGDFVKNIDIDWSGIFSGLKDTGNFIIDPIKKALGNVDFSGIWQWDPIGDLLDKITWSDLSDGIKDGLSQAFDDISNLGEIVGDLPQDLIDGIIKGFTTGDFSGIGDAVQTFIDKVKEFFGISSPATTMIPIGADILAGIIKGFLDNIGTAASTLFNAFMNLVTPLVNGVIQTAQNLLSGLGTVISGAWTRITTAVSNAMNSIGSVISGGWTRISTTVSNILSGIGTAISTAWNNAKTAVSNAVTGIQSAVSTGWTNASNAVKRLVTNIGTSVSNGFTNQVNNVKNGMSKIGTAISNGWTTAKNTASNRLSSMANDVSTGFTRQRTAVSNAMTNIRNSVSDGWTRARTATSSALSSLVSTVQSGFQRALNAVVSAMNSIVNAVQEGFQRAVNAVASGISSMASAVANGIGDVVSPFYDLGSEIQSAVSGIDLYSSGVSIISSLVSGIRSQAGAAAAAVRAEMSSARALIPDSPAKEGPFSGRGWVTYSGAAIIDGLADGIKSRSGVLEKSLSASLGNLNSQLALAGGGRLAIPQVRGGGSAGIGLGGGIGGGGGTSAPSRSLSIAPGAIVVQAPQSNPGLVASKVLDRIVRQTVS